MKAISKPHEDTIRIRPSPTRLCNFIARQEFRPEDYSQRWMQGGQRRRVDGGPPLSSRRFIDGKKLVRTLEQRIIMRFEAHQAESILLQHTAGSRIGFERA